MFSLSSNVISYGVSTSFSAGIKYEKWNKIDPYKSKVNEFLFPKYWKNLAKDCNQILSWVSIKL